MRQVILILSLVGLVGCSNPYSHTERAVGDGLLGGADGAAIGGIAGGGKGALNWRRSGCCWRRSSRRSNYATADLQVVQQRWW